MKYLRNAFLLTLSLFLFAGCTNPFAKQITEDQNDIVTPENVIETEEPMKIIACNMLKNKDSEKECDRALNETAADMLFSEIQQTFDLKRCDELPSDMVQNCVNYINSSGVKGPISETEIDMLGEAMIMVYPEATGSITDEEIDSDLASVDGYYDLEKCALLTTSGLKEYCENAIIMKIDEEKVFEIIEKGNSSLCDTLKTEEMKTFCKQELGIAIENPIDETVLDEPIEDTSLVLPNDVFLEDGDIM